MNKHKAPHKVDYDFISPYSLDECVGKLRQFSTSFLSNPRIEVDINLTDDSVAKFKVAEVRGHSQVIVHGELKHAYKDATHVKIEPLGFLPRSMQKVTSATFGVNLFMILLTLLFPIWVTIWGDKSKYSLYSGYHTDVDYLRIVRHINNILGEAYQKSLDDPSLYFDESALNSERHIP